VHPEGVLQAIALVGVLDFFGIAGGDRGHEIRINDAALHQVDRAVIEIILQPIPGPIGSRVQAHQPNHMVPSHTLMHDVVDGVANPRVGHAEIFVPFEKQHRDQGGLPIMAVDDVGMLVGLEHELQGRPAEKGKAFRIVPVAVEGAPIEEISMRMGFDKKAL